MFIDLCPGPVTLPRTQTLNRNYMYTVSTYFLFKKLLRKKTINKKRHQELMVAPGITEDLP